VWNSVARITFEVEDWLIVSEEERVPANDGVAASERRGKSAVEVLVRVRFEGDRIDVCAVSLHIRRREHGTAKESVKRTIEVQEVGSVAAPMQRVEALQALEGLCGHRTLHRVKDKVAADTVGREQLFRAGNHGTVGFQAALRIAEVPR